ncbi:MAG: hypothetical protein LUC47_08175 [Clostridiales bacterium]|nr:hypothetical protein [Clostridiales bacterium]
MKNLGTLYRFEWKKLWGRRSARVLSLLLLAAVLVLNLAPLVGQTQVHYLDENGTLVEETVSKLTAARMERAYAMDYSGQPLDDDLIDELQAFIAQYGYDCLNMYWIFYSICQTDLNPWSENTTEAAIQESMYKAWEYDKYGLSLTEEELSYWEENEAKISFPLTIAYTRGYKNMLEEAYYLNLLLLCYIIFILSESFSLNRRLNTQIWFQSSKFGHGPTIAARTLAGVSYSLVSCLTVYGLSALIQFGVYGMDGWDAPIQQIWASLLGSNLPLCAGQAVLVICALSVLVVTAVAAVVMLLSEVTQSGVTALAVSYGVLIVTALFNMELFEINRVLSQIWNYFPIQRISYEVFYDERLVHLAGHALRGLPFTVLLYGSILILALPLCAGHAKRIMRERK